MQAKAGHATSTVLADRIAERLRTGAGMTARELSTALQGDVGRSVTRREVNAVLYSDDRFHSDSSTRPVWHLSA